MIYFNKFFKIPGPADLGMSDNNHAMAIDFMRNHPGELTWDNYYTRVKKEYPIKYFFAATLPGFFVDCWKTISRRPKEIIYWLQCHLIPKHRYHMIDIRQPKTVNDPTPYRYGWIDTDTRIEYAMMNLLCEFVETEMPGSYFIPTEEEAAKDDGVDYNYAGYKAQLASHKEYMAIYNFWKTERPLLDKKYDDLLDAWSKSRSNGGRDNPETMKLWASLNEAEAFQENKLDEMLVRLVKIRRCLWT